MIRLCSEQNLYIFFFINTEKRVITKLVFYNVIKSAKQYFSMPRIALNMKAYT